MCYGAAMCPSSELKETVISVTAMTSLPVVN